MAISFSYNASEYEERSFQTIPEGDHRIRVNEVTEQMSQTGKQMLKFVFDVSGYSSKLFYYLVFDPNNSKMTNQKVGEIFKSFGITNPDINAYPKYVGRVGAARVRHRMYQGEPRAEVWYFIAQSKQNTLPAWKEPATQGQATAPQPQAPMPMYQAAPQYQPGYQAPTPVPPQPVPQPQPQQQQMGWTETYENAPF